MTSVKIDSLFQIFQMLAVFSVGWYILWKGKARLDNSFFVLFSAFHQVIFSAVVVEYFPFRTAFFFIISTLFQIISTAFIYSFPRSTRLNKKWFSIIFVVSGTLIYLFFTLEKTTLLYIVSGIFFFLLNTVFIVRKQKYLSSEKRVLVSLFNFAVAILTFMLPLFTVATIGSYNIATFKIYSLFISPLIYVFIYHFMSIRLNTETSLNHSILKLIVFFSFLMTILLHALSPYRALFIKFFSSVDFFVPYTIGLVIGTLIVSAVTSYISMFIYNYFDSRQIDIQKAIATFRTKASEISNYKDFFSLFEHDLYQTFKEIESFKFLALDNSLIEDGEIRSIKYAPEEKMSPITSFFSQNNVPFMLKTSTRITPEIFAEFERLDAAFIIPFYKEDAISAFFIFSGKEIKQFFTEHILSFTNIAIHNLSRLILISDIVEREKHLQETQYFQEVGKMVSIIAHELRTPLTSIMFNMDVLSESLKTVEDFDMEYLDISRKELKRLNDTVEKMLTYGRVAKPLAEKNTFKTFFTELSYIFKSSKIKIDFHNSTKGAFYIDWNKLKQVLINLINNAIHSIERSEKGELVSVHVAEQNKMLKITVKDDGKGIPKEKEKNIFEPFFTTKQNGNGLGLAICRKNLKILNGKIALSQNSEKGAEFTVTIPKKQIDV